MGTEFVKRNPVSKFNRLINKPRVERDKTKYRRKEKHKGGNECR